MPVTEPPLRPIAIVVALACALTALCGSPGPAAASPADRRGVAIDIVFGEPVADELADVDAAAAMGANSVRVAVQWAGMEPTAKGRYATWYLDRLDAVVTRAARHGVGVMLTPVFTPCWAAASVAGVPLPCLATHLLAALGVKPPADPSHYGDFAAFLAARYGSRLDGLEIWNEPNLASFWDTSEPAADYARLLRAAYPKVKAAAPDVPVVAGALAGADATFLRELYEAGIQGFYDVLSLHPYNDGRDPAALVDPRWTSSTFLQGLRSVRDARTQHGDAKPVWLTELGWNTSSQRGQLWLDGVTPDQQADFLGRALRMLDDPAWGIGFTSGVYVYRLRDTGVDPADPQRNYGLMTYRRTPKAALAAVTTAFAAAEAAAGTRVGVGVEAGADPATLTAGGGGARNTGPSARGPVGRRGQAAADAAVAQRARSAKTAAAARRRRARLARRGTTRTTPGLWARGFWAG